MDSIITIEFNRWTGGPSYKGKVSSSDVLIKGSMFYSYLTSQSTKDRGDRSGPYKMNRGALVDSIITIELNRWTGGPS